MTHDQLKNEMAEVSIQLFDIRARVDAGPTDFVDWEIIYRQCKELERAAGRVASELRARELVKQEREVQ